jgi:hypothetical protein
MITEDYVSFETAKLLKEKGFDSPCMGRYSVRSREFHLDCTKMCNNGGLFECAAPSQSMTMKWLREVHNIDVSIIPLRSHKEYLPRIESDITSHDAIPCRKYEEACEAAIKYCLENLI